MSIWHKSDDELLSYYAFIDEFEKAYPDALDTRVGDMNARISSGDIGDVFAFSADQIYRLVSYHTLVSLDGYASHLKYDFGAICSAAYDAGCYKGRLYMVSSEHTRPAFIVNLESLSEEGLDLPANDWTWEEFTEEYAPKLVKLNDNGMYSQVPMFLHLNWAPVFVLFLEGWGEMTYPYLKMFAEEYDNRGAIGILRHFHLHQFQKWVRTIQVWECTVEPEYPMLQQYWRCSFTRRKGRKPSMVKRVEQYLF